jgi:hypothetical protein
MRIEEPAEQKLPAGLSPEEADKVKVFDNLRKLGHKTYSTDKAKNLASEAADQLNSATKQGYTVYGSTYHTYDAEGKEAGHFAVVSVGAGETKADISRRARQLRDMGWNASPIDNEDIKGIVVSQ